MREESFLDLVKVTVRGNHWNDTGIERQEAVQGSRQQSWLWLWARLLCVLGRAPCSLGASVA